MDWTDEVRTELLEEVRCMELPEAKNTQHVAAHIRAALGEIERLRKALESMVKDGCGFAPRICPERSPDPEDWCWSCQARAALRGER